MSASPVSRSDGSSIRQRPGAGALAMFLVVVVVLLTVDLVSKSLAFEHVAGMPVVLPASEGRPAIPPHDRVVLIPRILALQLTLNYGAVFGLGQGGRWVFVLFSIVATGLIVTAFRRSSRGARVLHVVLAAVLAGALGNLYDRLRYGAVRDLLHLFPDVMLPFGWTWPGGSGREVYPWIFNVADVCLVVGLFVIVILIYRHDRRELQERRREAKTAA